MVVGGCMLPTLSKVSLKKMDSLMLRHNTPTYASAVDKATKGRMVQRA